MELVLIPIWLLLSIVIGAAGSKREIGFFSAFLISLLLSPLCGLIITAFSRDRSDMIFKSTVIQLLERKQINHDDL